MLLPALLPARPTAACELPGPSNPSGPQEGKKPGSHKWWQSARNRAEIGLTEQQSVEIERLFQADVPKLRVRKEELDREEKALSALLAGSATTEAQVVRQLDRVEAARSDMSKVRALMLFRMRRVLSAEQRIKLEAIHDHRERKKPKSEPR